MSRANPFADWKPDDVARHNATVASRANKNFRSGARLTTGANAVAGSIPEPAISGAGREGNGKCAPYMSPQQAAPDGKSARGASGNRFAKFERRKKGERNKLEAEYEAYLGLMQKSGAIESFMFEGIKLRLADGTSYTPDFLVFASDGVVEIHDTKGTTTKKLKAGNIKGPWIEEDARIKLAVVAEQFPFRTFAVFKANGTWQKKQF